MGTLTGMPPGRPKLDERAFEVAKRIRKRRTDLGMQASDIASIMSIPTSRYLPWEKQFGPSVEKKYLPELAAALQVNEEWLAYGTGPATNPDSALAMAKSHQHSLSFGSTKINEVQRRALGDRMRHRRESMGLARKEVARACNCHSRLLALLERAIPVKATPLEAALEKVLRVPEGWLRNSGMKTPAVTTDDLKVTVKLDCSTVAEEIRAIGSWLCRASVPIRTADYQNLAHNEKRNADMFALRYGVDGEENSKLQSIGDRLSITRERVRQAVTKLTERSDRLVGITPLLDRLSTEIKQYLPAKAEVIDNQFRSLLGENLSVLSAERFAREVLGRSIVSITAHANGMAAPGEIVLIDPAIHEPDMVRAVRDAALRMIRRCGGAQIHMVVGMASDCLQRGVAMAEAVRAIRLLDCFEWINEVDGWFWLGHEKESRVWPVVRKVLSIAQQVVDIEDICVAISRSRRINHEPGPNRMAMIEAPPHILTEILRRVPWLDNVQYDDFRLKEPSDPQFYLSETERVIYQHLIQKGNTASRWAINRDVVDGNLAKQVVVQVCLDSSPILARISRGVFSLRGKNLVPSAITVACGEVGGEAAQKRQQAPFLADALGYYRLNLTLSKYMVAHSYFEVPAAFGNALAVGDYHVEGIPKPVTYAVTPSGSRRLKGLVRTLMDRGYKVGDEIAIAFNVASMAIIIHDPATA